MKVELMGLVGHGFVGEAVYENLKDDYTFLIYDKNPDKANCDNIKYIVDNAKVIFVALPTPMYLNGECDLSIIFDVMEEIYKHYNNNIVIIKSTVIPGTCKEIHKRYPNMRIVFNPEFLTEANHIQDFKNCNRMIFGGNSEDTNECVKILKNIFPDKAYFTTDWEAAEVVKYFINAFLATKVSFANEMKQICDVIDTDYDDIVALVLHDERIGKSHFKAPGPDGYHGFGGKCFPKDLNALIYFSEKNSVKSSILKASWENLEVREVHDWLNIAYATSGGSK